jgi:hypothetical protein
MRRDYDEILERILKKVIANIKVDLLTWKVTSNREKTYQNFIFPIESFVTLRAIADAP